VTPGASKDSIGGLWRGAEGEERLAIRVAAPPDKGKANQAVVKLLAKVLGLPRSALTLIAGEKDRLKSIAIESDSRDVIERIEKLLAKGRESVP
jgi:uncharacterized protein (TIGR00251 family)